MASVLKGLKKKKEENFEVGSHYKYLIVGSDISSILLAETLSEKWGPKSFKMIFSSEVTESDIFFPGPSVLRGKENFEVFDHIYSSSSLKEKAPLIKSDEQQAVMFYKENNFYPFGQRHRPSNQILGKEDFYLNPWREIELKERFFSEGIFKYQKNSLIDQIKSIYRRPYKGKESWILVLMSGEVLATNFLFFAQSPALFYHYLQDKNHYSESFHQFCQTSENRRALVYQAEIKNQFSIPKGTFFLPQLVSEENGHFIGQISPNLSSQSEGQQISFFCFLNENEERAEEIQKKVKLLKRVLKRVFPEFANLRSSQFKESIMLTQFSPSPHVSDSLFDDFKSEILDFRFLGIWSPVAKDDFSRLGFSFSEREKICNLSRSLLSYHFAAETLI